MQKREPENRWRRTRDGRERRHTTGDGLVEASTAASMNIDGEGPKRYAGAGRAQMPQGHHLVNYRHDGTSSPQAKLFSPLFCHIFLLHT